MLTPASITAWFHSRSWDPLPFQLETWAAHAAGKSGLIHAPTGLGKTLAAWLGPVLHSSHLPGLKVLWLTPLRALATDTVRGLQDALDGLAVSRRVEARTGDTTSYARNRQKTKPPYALVTTPESLSLMLTDPAQVANLSTLHTVIVDEWHELLGSKRGVQTELCLAHLRTLHPQLQTWGLSATIGNLTQARDVLLGSTSPAGITIHGHTEKHIEIETLMPEDVDTFPWSGHLGIKLIKTVIQRIALAQTTLIFTNTRSQTEIWYQHLLDEKPEWADTLAMHHSSIDRAEREITEQRLRDGTVRAVVSTSSLDLGVDFAPVDQVIQIGSPKGIARLLQRAGRSGHRPGATSRVLGVPTNALELIEFAAAREAMTARRIEARTPIHQPLDLLAQHLITIALGSGFTAPAMLREVRTTHAFRHLSDTEWQWCLTFITTGGALHAYPHYHKVSLSPDGIYRLTDPHLARIHRFSIGTIVADASISLRLKNGRRLGSVEEWFISGIKPGKCFIFGGKMWELVRIHHLQATVQVPEKKKARGDIPSWIGSKSPLSTELSAAVGAKLLHFREGQPDPAPEMEKAAHILRIQAAWSLVPRPDECLIEHTTTRDGDHYFLYPFAGRLANGALGTLISYRLSKDTSLSLRVTSNDYGVEIYSPHPLDLDTAAWRALLTPHHLLDDLLASVNAAELGRHHFREIARVAGLILTGTPGAPPTLKALQTSSGLLWDVFSRYDPSNLLLAQSQREVLERQMDYTRLHDTIAQLQHRQLILKDCPRLTPLAFPLWADRVSHTVGKEDPATVLALMLEHLETAAAAEPHDSAE